MKAFFKSLKIKSFSTEDDIIKGSLAERVIRTIKRKIYMYMTQNNTRIYHDKLQDIVNSYNASYYSGIGMTPNQVNSTNVIFAIHHNEKKMSDRISRREINVGDTVKLLGKKGIMDRGYYINWTEENYIVKEILDTTPVTYKVEDLLGEALEGSFYRQELQIVEKPVFYQIEKKIKSRYKNGKKEWYIKWLGYPEKFNTWEPASAIP